jgi:hypothetical protein
MMGSYLAGRHDQVYAAPQARWDLKFTKRNRDLYRLEDKKPFRPDLTESARMRINQFFNQQTHGLLPKSYSYQSLHDFLALADTSIFDQNVLTCLNVQDMARIVLLDERMDDQSFMSRQWQEYEQYPPRGTAECTAVLHSRECYEKLIQTVCFSLF